MKKLLYWLTYLAVVTCDIPSRLPPLDHPIPHHLHSPLALPKKPHLAFDPSAGVSNPPPATPDTNTVYGAAWCKGSRLMMAMTLPPEQAINHLNLLASLWTGPLINEMMMWGYKDETVQPNGDNSCDFEELGLQRVCASLGIGTKTRANGGPHMCYKIVHHDGSVVITQPPEHTLPSVDRQVYKVGENLYRVSSPLLHTTSPSLPFHSVSLSAFLHLAC